MREMRDAIVAAALAWVGTPYHHAANCLGAGVDCLMLVVEAYRAVGLLPADFDPRPYPMQWFLHRDDERFLIALGSHMRRTTDPQPADVLMFRYGRSAAHAGIVTAPGYMVHAYREARRVEVVEIQSFESRFDSAWTAF